jgi:transcriptional regulator EpsA
MSVEVQAKLAEDFPEAVRADFFEIVEPGHHVTTQDQFIKWTQTDLQRIFPHARLICGVGQVHKGGVQIEHIIGRDFPDEYIQTLQCSDGLTNSPIIARWMKEQQPILFDPEREADGDKFPSEWLNNFYKFELHNVAAHGLVDTDRHASYFCFLGIPAVLNHRHAYLLKLLVPHMHFALSRVVSTPQFKRKNSPRKNICVTSREKEILQWLSTGKSNWEIAQVIGLSEATVKNHLYHIMRKLHTSTRAQTVAKALSTRLIALKLAIFLSAGTVLFQTQELWENCLSPFA